MKKITNAYSNPVIPMIRIVGLKSNTNNNKKIFQYDYHFHLSNY